MRHHDKPELRTFRRNLRKEGTKAEAILWLRLKNSQLENRRFRRQHSIDNFILDFYCPCEKLIIELDGEGHFSAEGTMKDDKRDTDLAAKGYRTLRFENDAVLKDIEAVLFQIKEAFLK